MSAIVPLARGPELPAEIAERIGPDLVSTFDRAAARTPGRIALVERRGARPPLRRSYAELAERSRAVAARLVADGVRPGDRIALCAPNRVAVVELLIGAWRAGAAVVPFDVRMAPETIAMIVAAAGPVAAYLDPSIDPAPFAATAVRALDDALGDPAEATPDLPALDPESMAEVLFTSGTTGTPKGVMLSHRAMVAASAAVCSLIAPVAHRGLAIIPLSHMYGQMAPLVAGWIRSSTLVFPNGITPTAIIEALAAERITALTIVPAVADLLRAKIEREAAAQGASGRLLRAQRLARRLPFPLRRLLFRSVLRSLGGSLALLTSGGARLDPATAAFFEAMGIRVMEGYGSTEMAAIAGHTHNHRPHGTAGRLMPGVEIAFGADGELLSRGPAMASGYYGRPDLSAEVFAGGWAHSGDAATIDAAGNLVVAGRTRDRITLPSGLKIYPGEIEERLRAAHGVADAVVLLLAGRLAGYVIADSSVDLDALRDAANAAQAVGVRLTAVRRYPEADFPRTHTLKIRRDQAAARLAEAPAAPAEAEPAAARHLPEDPVGAFVALADEIAEHHGLRLAASPATVLAESGLDSIATAEFAVAVTERFGLLVDETALANRATIASLAHNATAADGSAERADARRVESAFGLVAIALRECFSRLLLHPLLFLAARPRVEGREEMERAVAAMGDGRDVALFTGNHGSHLDIPLLRYALPGRLRRKLAIAAAADYFFERPLLRYLVSYTAAAFPFERKHSPRAALTAVERQLATGWSIALFPEGTRSRDGAIGTFRPGIGLIAAATGAPVVPYALIGAHAVLPPGGWLRPGRTIVRFGLPLRAQANEEPRAFAARLEAAVRALHDGAAER
jgi:long-chain acyl-CoA synthetase